MGQGNRCYWRVAISSADKASDECMRGIHHNEENNKNMEKHKHGVEGNVMQEGKSEK